MLTQVTNRLASRAIVLVLGMHRSGTSALTRTLALAGCTLPQRLLDGVAGDNDLGYWESWALTDYHDRLFARIGTKMLADEPIDPNWFVSSDARLVEADLLAIVRREWRDGVLSSGRPWVIKEPRICRLLPLWRRVLERTGRHVIAIHMLREPSEVASSLLRRKELAASGFTRERAEQAWLEHVALSEYYTRDVPRTFVSIDLLMGDWRAVIDRVMPLLPKGRLQPTRAAAEIDDFLRPSLRHHRRDPAQLPCSSDLGAFRDTLMDAARWGTEPDRIVCDAAYARLMSQQRFLTDAPRADQRV